ncbi:hypothetical protein ACFU93_29220 [Streptomyces sp. NPDC057611]
MLALVVGSVTDHVNRRAVEPCNFTLRALVRERLHLAGAAA